VAVFWSLSVGWDPSGRLRLSLAFGVLNFADGGLVGGRASRQLPAGVLELFSLTGAQRAPDIFIFP